MLNNRITGKFPDQLAFSPSVKNLGLDDQLLGPELVSGVGLGLLGISDL